MDLEPFSRINPCGYPGLAVTSLAELGVPADPARAGDDLALVIARLLQCVPLHPTQRQS
jgi:lipoyl(octanoyl) transferase